MCIELMYRHIRQLPARQIFTTREMLPYGLRSAVDAALHRMVKSEFITRVARGVFVRDGSIKPSILEIVQAKARAFGAKVANLPNRFKQKAEDGRDKNIQPDERTFAKLGGSSSFWTIHGRAYLKQTCARKMQLSDTRVGQIVNNLWQLTRKFCSNLDARLATSHLKRSEREQLWLASSRMPAWLSDLCREKFPRPEVKIAFLA